MLEHQTSGKRLHLIGIFDARHLQEEATKKLGRKYLGLPTGEHMER